MEINKIIENACNDNGIFITDRLDRLVKPDNSKRLGGGLAIQTESCKVIAYNKDLRDPNPTLAHELGHFIMHHLDPETYREEQSEQIEFEARVFASVFMAIQTIMKYHDPATDLINFNVKELLHENVSVNT